MRNKSVKKTSKTPRAATRHKAQHKAVVKLSGEGVVEYYVHGLRSTPAATEVTFTPAEVVDVVQTGLPVQELEDLRTHLNVTTEKFVKILGTSKATLHRQKSGTLKSDVSDRVVRYARLLGTAGKVFGDLKDARQWLGSPQFGLGGAVPLEYAKTEVGAREVENLLGRIEYGVYS